MAKKTKPANAAATDRDANAAAPNHGTQVRVMEAKLVFEAWAWNRRLRDTAMVQGILTQLLR